MILPRLEIDLDKLYHNASTLVEKLGRRDISVTGVTKACMGDPKFAATLLAAGVRRLGDSRIENIERMRHAGITAPITLIRSPMPSQVDQVVMHANVSHNTELDVISALSVAAGKAGVRHSVLLMVELGDLREGIMPEDLEAIARRTLRFPHIDLCGVGTNLACFNGIAPDAKNMRELSRMADHLDRTFRPATTSITGVVSGGNSSNLPWAISANNVGRINNLRLGEAILLGVEPLNRTSIHDLYNDAITLFAEVIETKIKPVQPWGQRAHSPFEQMSKNHHNGTANQMVLAIGHQDIDPAGLTAQRDIHVVGASSDHLIVTTKGSTVRAGDEIAFQLDYSALLRAMTSPYVTKKFQQREGANRASAHSLDFVNRIHKKFA